MKIMDIAQKRIPSINVPIENSDANLIAANILSGKSIFGVAGNVIAGKPFAEGSTSTFSPSTGWITVSGLSFQPRFVFARCGGNQELMAFSTDGTYISLQSATYNGAYVQANGSSIFFTNATFSSNGFSLQVNDTNNYTPVSWLAIG